MNRQGVNMTLGKKPSGMACKQKLDKFNVRYSINTACEKKRVEMGIKASLNIKLREKYLRKFL